MCIRDRVEAVIQRELWTERDPRVPPHRRIDADGHPTIGELEARILMNQSSSIELLAVERKHTHDVIGYCGLIDSGRAPGEEPELAFELLRRVWNHGYATEASLAVLDWAKSSGHRRLWATVRDWNTASLRVLAKVGFVVQQSANLGVAGATRIMAPMIRNIIARLDRRQLLVVADYIRRLMGTRRPR